MDYGNLRQSLLEAMADWLDSEDVEMFLAIEEMEEADQSKDSLLHQRMAEAAFAVFQVGTQKKPDPEGEAEMKRILLAEAGDIL